MPQPLALQLNYAALDFNFTSWMSPDNLRVLQSEQSSGHLSSLAEQKDHFSHISPLSMVGDRKVVRRRRSWKDAIRNLTSPVAERPPGGVHYKSSPAIKTAQSTPAKSHGRIYMNHDLSSTALDEAGSLADEEDGADFSAVLEEDKPIEARVRFNPVVSQKPSPEIPESGGPSPVAVQEPLPLGTRLTMTSRTGYFQDRVISPSMVCTFRDGMLRFCRLLRFLHTRCVPWQYYSSAPTVIQTLLTTITYLRSWLLTIYLRSFLRCS